MDVLGRRNGAKKRKWTSGESQVNFIHYVDVISRVSQNIMHRLKATYIISNRMCGFESSA